MAPPTGDLAPSALALGIADEEPWRSPRCVIVTSEDLFLVDRSRLWIDALHIQVVDGTLNPVPIWPQSWGVAYVTNTVVQGDRASNALGAEAFRGGGGLYAEGMHALVPLSHRPTRKGPLFQLTTYVECTIAFVGLPAMFVRCVLRNERDSAVLSASSPAAVHLY